MSKTYSERRAAAYFTAARTLYTISADILDDVVLDTELLGRTLPWAVERAHETRQQAILVEDTGRACISHQPSPATERSLSQASARYHAARTLLDQRLRRAQERTPV